MEERQPLPRPQGFPLRIRLQHPARPLQRRPRVLLPRVQVGLFQLSRGAEGAVLGQVREPRGEVDAAEVRLHADVPALRGGLLRVPLLGGPPLDLHPQRHRRLPLRQARPAHPRPQGRRRLAPQRHPRLPRLPRPLRRRLPVQGGRGARHPGPAPPRALRRPWPRRPRRPPPPPRLSQDLPLRVRPDRTRPPMKLLRRL